MTRPHLEVADVIRQYGADYLARYGAVTAAAQRRALQGEQGDAGDYGSTPVQ